MSDGSEYPGVPVARAQRHDVAAGRVRGHRRIEDGAELQVLLQVRGPLRAARGVDLVPEPRDLAEAPLLVVVVHVGRPGLHDVVAHQGLEVPVEVRDRLQTHARGLDGVELCHARLTKVGHRAEAQRPPRRDEFLGDVGARGEQLDAVHPVLHRPLHPRPRLLGPVDGALIPAAAGRLVVKHPGRDDLVARAAIPLAHRHGVRRERDAAHGGHAVGHPQLVDVLGFGVLRRPSDVNVVVDDARHDVHAGSVDLEIGVLWRALRRGREARRPGRTDLTDAILLDDDVDRATGRGAGAVDQDGPADDQRLERPCALASLAGRRGNQLTLARLREETRLDAEQGQQGEDRQNARAESTHVQLLGLNRPGLYLRGGVPPCPGTTGSTGAWPCPADAPK